MNNRKFGVEIECGLKDVDERTYESTYSYGYSYPDPEGTARRILTDAGFKCGYGKGQFDIGRDGTDIEVRTPPLQGIEGLRTLYVVMTTLSKNGGYVTRSDGMHVHHDAPEFVGEKGEENRVKILRSWEDNEHLIEKFVEPWRRGYDCCPKVKKPTLNGYYNDYYDYYDGERAAMNLLALEEHGTIEIRLHQGTLDPNEAIAWIKFGQYFIDTVLRRKTHLTESKSCDDLLNRLRASKRVKAQLRERK